VVSVTVYAPAGKLLTTPETTGAPFTKSGKSPTTLVPPQVFTTVLFTRRVALHAGTVIVTLESGVVTVWPNVKALPIHDVVLSTVIS